MAENKITTSRFGRVAKLGGPAAGIAEAAWLSDRKGVAA